MRERKRTGYCEKTTKVGKKEGKIKKIEGYLFETSGCEHGPTVMKWRGDWDQDKYEQLRGKSWCDNEFTYDIDSEGNTLWDSDKIAEEIDFGLIPGKKYYITIEEI